LISLGRGEFTMVYAYAVFLKRPISAAMRGLP